MSISVLSYMEMIPKTGDALGCPFQIGTPLDPCRSAAETF
jgi:hypothetical protein